MINTYSYEHLLWYIKQRGVRRDDRTGIGTLSSFGHNLRYDLTESFPLITTKKIHFKSVLYELLWFLRGDTNTKFLKNHGISIWDEWADKNGDLGPIYGKQWRDWKVSGNKTYSIDQIKETVRLLKENPNSRRIIVSAWNVADLDKMRLPPCPLLFQFYVQGKSLSCQVYQRSADMFLGVPFDIATYALLTHMFAHVCDLIPHELIMCFGDTHIYLNHLEQVDTQLSRTIMPFPSIKITRKVGNILLFKEEDFLIENYNPHPPIKAPIAV